MITRQMIYGTDIPETHRDLFDLYQHGPWVEFTKQSVINVLPMCKPPSFVVGLDTDARHALNISARLAICGYVSGHQWNRPVSVEPSFRCPPAPEKSCRFHADVHQRPFKFLIDVATFWQAGLATLYCLLRRFSCLLATSPPFTF